MPDDQPEYRHEPFGTAHGIFRSGKDDPSLVVFDEEMAQDLATVLNWAATDRERHKQMPAHSPSTI